MAKLKGPNALWLVVFGLICLAVLLTSAAKKVTVRCGYNHEDSEAQRTVYPAKVQGPVQEVGGAEFILEVYYSSTEARDAMLAADPHFAINTLDPDGNVEDEMHQYGSSKIIKAKIRGNGIRFSITLGDGPGDYWLPRSGSALYGGQTGIWAHY